MGDIGTYEDIFKISIHAETELARFYKRLKAKFHQSEIRSFLKEMARDEGYHIKELNKIHDSVSNELLHSPADPALLEEGRSVEKLKILEMVDSIETLDDAYNKIEELEFSELNSVYLFLLSKFIDSDEKGEFLNTEMKAHLAKIDAFKSRYL